MRREGEREGKGLSGKSHRKERRKKGKDHSGRHGKERRKKGKGHSGNSHREKRGREGGEGT